MSDSDFDVLLLASRFQVRGSCATTLRLVERLPLHGVKPELVCPCANLVDAARRKRLRVRELRYLDFPILDRLALRTLETLYSDRPPELIHLQSRRLLNIGTRLARRLNRPFILTVHDYLRPRERLVIDRKWCGKIIAVSESVRQNLLTRAGIPQDLVAVVASGVEAGVATCRPLEPGHVPVIGTAGPLEAVKGFPFFLGAARQVLDRKFDVEFLVAGAGPEEANLRRLARHLGIAGKVTFVPYLLDFRRSLQAMDIFVLPSLQQGLGTVMLEAMALGKPVIASGVGGVHTIVRHEETGLMVPPSNSAELARRIVELLENPARARTIGEAARDLVERDFSIDRMVGQVVEVYRDVARSYRTLGVSTVTV